MPSGVGIGASVQGRIVTASLGLEPGTVRLVLYDATWPALFDAEAERLSAVVSPLGVRLEHMGSTAVPGLAAKPILDILAGYPEGTSVRSCIEALVGAGYVHRGEQGIPGREFFRRGTPRSYHIHLAVNDGPFWRDHLAFRDYLRRFGRSRDEYGALKAALAAQYPHDREAYIAAKGPFVQQILLRALSV
jgi:GrpB-like predicted nucleotidyltransferase (UPF0157 family)